MTKIHPARPNARNTPRKSPPARAQRFGSLWPWLTGILAITSVALSPALSNQLVRWDDYAYIVDNLIIRDLSLANLAHIFDPRTFVLDNYHPLTILSYAIEYRLVGTAPTLYHLDNLLLHLFNVACVAYFTWLLTRRTVPTVICAALFGLHPMRVESVVWAAERKDLLYTAFFLLSLISYTLYAREPGRGRRHYAVALICLVLSGLAKAQGVTLPLTFLLVDYWFRRTSPWRLIAEKLPFFAISIALGAWALIAQRSSLTAARLVAYSAIDRIAIANYNLVAYLYKLVAPQPLAAFYGYPSSLTLVRWAVVPVLALAALFIRYGRRSRPAVFGVLFFLATFIVVSQLLPIGDAIIADRFTYVPYLGLFLGIGFVVDALISRGGGTRTLTCIVASALFVVMTGMTFAQARTWRDTESLWLQVLRIDPDEPRAHQNLGVIHFDRGEVAAAIAHLERCVAHGAGYDRLDEAYRNLGAAYSSVGRLPEAIKSYDHAIQTSPRAGASWRGRGLAHAKAGQLDLAIADYSRAITLDSLDVDAFYSRANALRRLGRIEEAIADYTRTVKTRADYAPAYSNRANCFVDLGRLDRAVEDYSAALRLVPNDGLTYLNRSKAHYRLGQFDRARADYADATQRGAKDDGYLLTLESSRGQ